jgi:TrmH family RNA methyltransferase
MELPIITSTSNPAFKELVLLAQRRKRRSIGLSLFEGIKELDMAIEGGYKIIKLFYCQELIDDKDILAYKEKSNASICQPVTLKLFEKISYRGGTGGVISVFEARIKEPMEIELPLKPLVLVIESVEKPGNLGAMLRTSDAAAVDMVILCDPKTDIFNPNVIRSSLGTVFTNSIVQMPSREAIVWLKGRDIPIFSTSPDNGQLYSRADYSRGAAIVVGAESTGLSDSWLNREMQKINIPMLGKIDSMNVSVSAAIILYEARKQMGFLSK